jgi:hypothetical protein
LCVVSRWGVMSRCASIQTAVRRHARLPPTQRGDALGRGVPHGSSAPGLGPGVPTQVRAQARARMHSMVEQRAVLLARARCCLLSVLTCAVCCMQRALAARHPMRCPGDSSGEIVEDKDRGRRAPHKPTAPRDRISLRGIQKRQREQWYGGRARMRWRQGGVGWLQVAADGPAEGVEAQGEDVVADGDEPAPAGWSGPPWEKQRQGRAGDMGHKRVTRNGWGGVSERE